MGFTTIRHITLQVSIRDATENDVNRLATLAGTSIEGARSMLHGRTIRVYVDGDDIHGLVGFDVTEDAVRIGRLAGDPACFDALVDEPVRFAMQEGLPVEMVVLEDDQGVRQALREAEFEAIDTGPDFQGESSVRFRRPKTEHEC